MDGITSTDAATIIEILEKQGAVRHDDGQGEPLWAARVVSHSEGRGDSQVLVSSSTPWLVRSKLANLGKFQSQTVTVLDCLDVEDAPWVPFRPAPCRLLDRFELHEQERHSNGHRRLQLRSLNGELVAQSVWDDAKFFAAELEVVDPSRRNEALLALATWRMMLPAAEPREHGSPGVFEAADSSPPWIGALCGQFQGLYVARVSSRQPALRFVLYTDDAGEMHAYDARELIDEVAARVEILRGDARAIYGPEDKAAVRAFILEALETYGPEDFADVVVLPPFVHFDLWRLTGGRCIARDQDSLVTALAYARIDPGALPIAGAARNPPSASG